MVAAAFSEWISDWKVIRYTSRTCAPKISPCGSCLDDMLTARTSTKDSPRNPTNSRGEIWVTTHVFRFSEEAKRFLALSPLNQADIGVLLDLEAASAHSKNTLWRREPGNNGYPGGGWGGLLIDKPPDIGGAPPLPIGPVPFDEYFETYPPGTTPTGLTWPIEFIST